MSFLDFISDNNFQSFLACVTVVFAFISFLLTYQLSRPKIKIKFVKSSKPDRKNDAIYAVSKIDKDDVNGIVHLVISNNSPNKTQIDDIRFKYNNKFYFCANTSKEYSKEIKPEIDSNDDFPIKVDSVIEKVPLVMDSFQKKNVFIVFPNFPKTDAPMLEVWLRIYVVGKIFPIIKKVSFARTEKPIDLKHKFFVRTGNISAIIESNVPLSTFKQKVLNKKQRKR